MRLSWKDSFALTSFNWSDYAYFWSHVHHFSEMCDIWVCTLRSSPGSQVTLEVRSKSYGAKLLTSHRLPEIINEIGIGWYHISSFVMLVCMPLAEGAGMIVAWLNFQIHEIVKSWVSNTFPNCWILRWWPTSPTHWSMTFTCQTGKLGAWTFGRRGFPTVSSLFSVFLLLEIGLFFTVLLVWQILQSCVSPECLRMHFHSLALLWGIMWQASWQIWKVDDYPSSWGTWE